MRSTTSERLVVLMSRVARGDQGAFAELYDATSRSVFGIVLSVIGDRAQAEEVAQEVYVEAWKSSPRFDAAQGSPIAWLNTIAHRKAVDRVRSAERSRQRDQRHFESGVTGSDPDPSDVVVDRDEGRRVREALARLPEAQQDAIRLAYYEGRTQREVADFLEIPLGTAKSRIRDAMKRLRDALGESEA